MKVIITESQREYISSLYGNDDFNMNSIVIKEWVTPNNKYLILLDDLYDLETKVNLGNIWENFNNFKVFLLNIYETSQNLPEKLKESAKETLGKLIITESDNTIQRKIIINSLINEEDNWFKDLSNWIGDKGKEAYLGTTEFVNKSYAGAKKLIGNISLGEWSKVLDLIKKGTIYVARSLRSAMYHPVGLALDAILVATGIGKTVQWIPWAIIVALDVYELSTGDYEDKESPMWMRYLFLGVDILGMLTAGGVAKATKTLITTSLKGVNTTKGVASAISKTPSLKSFMLKLSEILGSAGTKMAEAISFLKTKFPKGAAFIEGIMGAFTRFVEKLKNMINKFLNKPVAGAPALTTGQKVSTVTRAATKATGVYYGVEKAIEKGVGMWTGEDDKNEQIAIDSLNDYYSEN